MITTLDEKFDSYGYKSDYGFITMADQKKFKYPPVKRVPQEYTQIESFISEAGEPIVDLVSPIIGEVRD